MASTRTDALKEADRLNQMVGPMLRTYFNEMQRLATVAGQELNTCLPGDGTIILNPERNYLPAELGAEYGPYIVNIRSANR